MVSVCCNRPKYRIETVAAALLVPQHLLSLPCYAFSLDIIRETYSNGPPLALY